MAMTRRHRQHPARAGEPTCAIPTLAPWGACSAANREIHRPGGSERTLETTRSRFESNEGRTGCGRAWIGIHAIDTILGITTHKNPGIHGIHATGMCGIRAIGIHGICEIHATCGTCETLAICGTCEIHEICGMHETRETCGMRATRVRCVMSATRARNRRRLLAPLVVGGVISSTTAPKCRQCPAPTEDGHRRVEQASETWKPTSGRRKRSRRRNVSRSRRRLRGPRLAPGGSQRQRMTAGAASPWAMPWHRSRRLHLDQLQPEVQVAVAAAACAAEGRSQGRQQVLTGNPRIGLQPGCGPCRSPTCRRRSGRTWRGSLRKGRWMGERSQIMSRKCRQRSVRRSMR
mmetsp:Transcript_17446/g.41408  ORF Transcript_17446/g.41408 Transcript_17446/m.41408 type:complete len:347 (-) Transcript_17446:175-1215(-)